VSRTPAASAARLKVTHPRWSIQRTEDGWQGERLLRRPGGRLGNLSVNVVAPTVPVLETLIMSFEDAGTGARTDGARAAGARVP
jgi:hypothetical protein